MSTDHQTFVQYPESSENHHQHNQQQQHQFSQDAEIEFLDIHSSLFTSLSAAIVLNQRQHFLQFFINLFLPFTSTSKNFKSRLYNSTTL